MLQQRLLWLYWDQAIENLDVSGHSGFLLNFLRLSLGNFTSLDRLNGNPHALNFTAWQLDSDALNIRTEFTPCVLY